MRNLKTIFTILIAGAAMLFISCGKTKVDANGCYYDIDEAAKTANKKNQDIMVIVTVEGDDIHSADFMDKVVRNPKFKSEIVSKYAVVCMDFSQKSYEQTVAAEDAKASVKKAAEEKANLMQKNTKYVTILNVTDTPIVYLLSKEKYLITGFFYDDNNRSFEGFMDLLNSKSASVDEMHKMIYQTKIGTAEEKVAAIDALYDATSPSYKIFLYDLIESIKKLDPSNKTGLAGKYLYETAVIRSDKAMMDGDMRTAVQSFVDIADEELIPAEKRQQALYTAAYLSSSSELDELPIIIGYLEKSIQIAPASENVPAIQHVIDSFKAKQN